MHPFDAAPSLSAEGSFEPLQQQQELGAAVSSPSLGTRAGRESTGGGVIRCRQGCRNRAKASSCAHCCCSSRAPGHVKTTPHVPASPQCSDSERHQQTLAVVAASASTAAAVDVDVEPIPKRPRLPSPTTTTTSSVDHHQPIATTTVLERFAREVSLDAVFRRARLAGGGPEPEVAYYTTVTIAGHVFRGVLYDVGRHSDSGSATAASDDTADGSGSDEGSSLSTAAGATAASCLDLTLRL